MCLFPAVFSRVGEEGVASLCYLTTLSLEDGDGLLIEFERPGCGENVLGMLFEWWWGLMYSRGGVTCCLSPDSDPRLLDHYHWPESFPSVAFGLIV